MNGFSLKCYFDLSAIVVCKLPTDKYHVTRPERFAHGTAEFPKKEFENYGTYLEADTSYNTEFEVRSVQNSHLVLFEFRA